MDSDEDDFIGWGTPLKPLEEDEVPQQKRIRIYDQTVTDEKGRRRFHGAFTGGFSAGYFNTVATKEGWAPSTFISSRSKKADQIQQQPEDFMDDEDFSEYGIAPRRVHATSKFKEDQGDRAGLKRRVHSEPQGPIPGDAPLKDLVKPVRASIGIRLLQKMGWRFGQGIGPRLKKKDKQAASIKVYGCSLPPTMPQEDDKDDPYALAFTFAPDDVSALVYTPKDNLQGIGYKGLDRTLVLSSLSSSDPTTTKGVIDQGKTKIAISGQAFGVGAFEDEDEDIYSKEDMSMYDFAIDEGLAEKAPSKQKPTPSNKTPAFANNTLEGFHLSAKKPRGKQHFSPPILPPDFKPVHKSSTKAPERQQTLAHWNLNRHVLSAEQRGALLGEHFRTAPPKDSVLNLLHNDDKKRLEEAKRKAVEPVIQTSEREFGVQSSGFRPFARDEEKQKRYEKYLSLLNAGRKDALDLIQPDSMTEWEKQREKAEFQRAAQLYRPLSSSLNTRFVSSSTTLEDDDKIEVKISDDGDKSDQMKAAELKMFGKLTRETYPWHPSTLLCKRFNVPNPYPDSTVIGLPKVKKDKFSLFNFLTVPSEQDGKKDEKTSSKSSTENKDASRKKEDVLEKESPKKKKVVAKETSRQEEIPAKDDDDTKEIEDERPPMDLFKAIFASSSEESDSDEKDEDEDDDANANKSKTSVNSAQKDDKEATKSKVGWMAGAKSGVFANLDLDALSVKPAHLKSASDNTKSAEVVKIPPQMPNSGTTMGDKASNETVEQERNEPELYGPKLPPSFSAGAPQVKIPVERKEEAAKKQKHNKHKHKSKSKKKKKHKHKKESNSKRYADSTSDSNEASSSNSDEEEFSDQAILERLKELKKKHRRNF